MNILLAGAGKIKGDNMTGKQILRLDKILAHMGKGSRREIKQIVKSKRVTVNGIVAQSADMHIRLDHDRIELDGEPVVYREYIYLMLHKPPGVLSATEDNYEKVVTDLLHKEHRMFSPFPVGRLDKDTEGLLLLTNDGILAHNLLSPKRHVNKTYFAKIDGLVTEKDIVSFAQGVILDDGYQTMPAKLVILKSGAQSEVELTIQEGKFHQVKRMFAAVGKYVTYLKRLSMGPLQLDHELALGSYRELLADEMEALQKIKKGE